MRLPLFLPPELSYCKAIEDHHQLIPTLLEHSEEDLLTFFECGCEDETWTSDVGGPIMEELINWLNNAYFSRKIGCDMAERAAVSVQTHFKSLKPHLSKDIAFIVEGVEHPISSMMFGGISPFFHDLIYREGMQKKQTSIALKGIDASRFQQLEEACYTGKLEYLWREEPEEILKLLKQASAWGLSRLEVYIADVYKRYIDESNIFLMFQMAEKEHLIELQRQCCAFINRHHYGMTLDVSGVNEMSAEITKITEKSYEILQYIEPIVTKLSLKEEAAESCEMLARMPKLAELDLTLTEKVSGSLLDLFPNVQTLNLSYCQWLNDDFMVQALAKCPSLQRLLVCGNSQLTFRTWAILIETPLLVDLDVSRCRSLNDEDLDLLAASCPYLIKINLSSCENLTDQAFLNLIEQCVDLQEVSLAWCPGITQEGIVAFAQRSNKIEVLDLRKTRCVTPQSIVQMAKLMPRLRELIVSKADLNFKIVQSIKELKKDLNLVY